MTRAELTARPDHIALVVHVSLQFQRIAHVTKMGLMWIKRELLYSMLWKTTEGSSSAGGGKLVSIVSPLIEKDNARDHGIPRRFCNSETDQPSGPFAKAKKMIKAKRRAGKSAS